MTSSKFLYKTSTGRGRSTTPNTLDTSSKNRVKSTRLALLLTCRASKYASMVRASSKIPKIKVLTTTLRFQLSIKITQILM